MRANSPKQRCPALRSHCHNNFQAAQKPYASFLQFRVHFPLENLTLNVKTSAVCLQE